MTDNALATLDSDQNFRHKVGDAILDLVLRVPASRENEIEHPEARARALGRSAARQASLMAGSMALPPGFLGWLTILPELMGVCDRVAVMCRGKLGPARSVGQASEYQLMMEATGQEANA